MRLGECKAASDPGEDQRTDDSGVQFVSSSAAEHRWTGAPSKPDADTIAALGVRMEATPRFRFTKAFRN